MTESGDAVENVLLPATSSSMTGLAVGLSWCGVAFLWGDGQPSMCSPEVAIVEIASTEKPIVPVDIHCSKK